MPRTMHQGVGTSQPRLGTFGKTSWDAPGRFRDVFCDPPANAYISGQGWIVSNERLKAAITHAGLDADSLAAQIGVDAKTIERWVSGRGPHRRNRLRLARALATTPDQLWPDHDPAPTPAEPPPE